MPFKYNEPRRWLKLKRSYTYGARASHWVQKSGHIAARPIAW